MMTKDEISAWEYLKRFESARGKKEREIKKFDRMQKFWYGVWVVVNVLVGIAIVALIWA